MTHFCRLMGTGAGRSAMATRCMGSTSTTPAHGASSPRFTGKRQPSPLTSREGEGKQAPLTRGALCTPPSMPAVPMFLLRL